MIGKRATLLAFLVLAISVLGLSTTVPAQVPQSLRIDLGTLFLKSDNKLNGTATTPAAPCGSPMTSPLTTASGTWTLDALPFSGNGTRYHFREPITLAVKLRAAGSAPWASTGYTVSAELKTDSGSSRSPPVSAQVQQAAPTAAHTLSFPINETVPLVSTDGKPFSLTVTVTATPPAMNAPNVNNVAIECSDQSKLGSPVPLIRGRPGEGDIDGDSIPDTEDSDRDGDGVSNTAEPGVCRFGETNITYADDGTLYPGNDKDGDGVVDEEECAKGFDPGSSQSIPPPPRTIGDILAPIILIVVILGLIGGLGFLFLKYGKTVTLVVASTPQLFIPPGQKGKFEVQVQNLVKKGEPRTFQLLVEGMPDGWDAKLSTDHVTLDPVGGAKATANVFLNVESPEHSDPESAVITVKAVPLNKAGRKDPLKLAGKAETITSINVPPGSAIPVKRGGAIKPAEAPGEAGAAAALPIGDLEGVGGAQAKKLEAAGVKTVEDLRTANVDSLHKKTKIPSATLTKWQQVADLVRVPGLSAAHATALLGGGIASATVLAEQESPAVASTAGVDEKMAKGWIKHAKKHFQPEGAPEPEAEAAPAAAGAAPKPALQVGGLTHNPAAFRQGESVKSTVSVTNNGGAASTVKLSLYVNDGLADVQTVTVKAGKAKDVQFKWTAQPKNKLNIRGELVAS